MSRSLTYTFPAGNASDVCATQPLAAAGNLALNGNLANSIHSEVSFISHGYSRSISITSTDATNRTFTIIGSQNGVPITAILNKPNATTVYTAEIFDVITSISVDGGFIGVSIGTGFIGTFHLIGINLERDTINYSLTTAAQTANSIPMAIYGSIANIENNGQTFTDIITNNNNIFTIKASATEDNYIFPAQGVGLVSQPLYKYILIGIIGVVGTIGNSVQLNFIQT